MVRLTDGDLARVAARTPLLQATWNYERQQGLGWAWCFAPVLARLYPDPAARRARLAEHTAYFNTQPTLASLALGAVAHLEEQRAAGLLSEEDAIPRVKSMLGSALAALGDRFFWFTLRPFVACLGVWLAIDGSWVGALALWMCYEMTGWKALGRQLMNTNDEGQELTWPFFEVRLKKTDGEFSLLHFSHFLENGEPFLYSQSDARSGYMDCSLELQNHPNR